MEGRGGRGYLGEISLALEQVFGRHRTVPSPVSGVYGRTYGDSHERRVVEDGIASVGRRLGHRPRVLVVKLGQDGHDRGANLVASAFSDFGFDVISGPLFQTPEDAAALAIAKDVDVVGASSLAAGHKTLVPELIAALRKADRDDIKVVVGGIIPAQDYGFLRQAGAHAIFGPGTNLVAAAGELLRLLGHNLPAESEIETAA